MSVDATARGRFPPFGVATRRDWWFSRIENKQYELFWEAHLRTAVFSKEVCVRLCVCVCVRATDTAVCVRLRLAGCVRACVRSVNGHSRPVGAARRR